MPIKIKSIAKVNPSNPEEPKKFYATVVSQGEINVNQLSIIIEKDTLVKCDIVQDVLYALVEAVTKELETGKIVRLGDLGSFRISVSSEGHNTITDVLIESINKSRVVFTAGKQLKARLSRLRFEKTANSKGAKF